MALDAQILLSILAHETTSGDISRTLRATPASYSLSLSTGTGANQAQVVWSDSGAIAADGQVEINLRGLLDDRGEVSLSSVKLLYIRNAGQTSLFVETDNQSPEDNWSTGPLAIAAQVLAIPVGGVSMLSNPSAAGWAVSGQAKVFWVGNASAATAGAYEIILIGEGTVT